MGERGGDRAGDRGCDQRSKWATRGGQLANLASGRGRLMDRAGGEGERGRGRGESEKTLERIQSRENGERGFARG